MPVRTEAHNDKATSKQQSSKRPRQDLDTLETELSPQAAAHHALRDPSRLNSADILRLQDAIGNREVAHLFHKRSHRPSSTLQGSVQRQRVAEQPEIVISGNPQFYTRAQRRNQYWAANSPRPGWPYSEALRELWSREALDDFADAVREYQMNIMGKTLDEADGILGPQTAVALEAQLSGSPQTEGETPQGEDAAGETAGSGSAPPGREEAEVREAPDWIMSFATDTPWPVHSAVYQEAMGSGGIGIEGAAPTWEEFLNQMGEMDFLGHRVVGHTAFLRRLDTAQRSLPAGYRVASVGSPGSRSQWRAAERLTASPHLFGMAIDINAGQNPWISNPEAPNRNTQYAWTIWRATWLMSRGAPVTPSESHRRAGSRSPASRRGEPQTTEAIWEYFNEANQATLAYLELAGNREEVQARLSSLGPSPAAPGPVVVRGRTHIGPYVPADIPLARLQERSIDDWMRVIEHDRLHWPGRAHREQEESPPGIMNLRVELVVALRDRGGLQWGACDLGETQSGDMMHFALDPPRFFRFREQVRQRLQERRRGLPAEEYEELRRAERTRYTEMEQRGRGEPRRRRPTR